MSTAIDQVLDLIGNMTVLELSELKKKYEDKFGVTAAAPEQEDFTVVLTGSGDKKIQVIKVVRELTGLGLKEAKDLVDGAPKPIKEAVPKAEAESIKKKIEEAGGTVELK